MGTGGAYLKPWIANHSLAPPPTTMCAFSLWLGEMLYKCNNDLLTSIDHLLKLYL